MATKNNKRTVIIRNAGGGARRAPTAQEPGPDWGNAIAGVAGGALGAVAGGLLVRWDVNPALASVVMAVGGGVAAATLRDSRARAAAAGLAAAGGGQLALALFANVSDKKEEPKAIATADKKVANAALPPGSLEAAFEQAQARLAQLEDDDARFANAIDVEDYEERAA